MTTHIEAKLDGEALRQLDDDLDAAQICECHCADWQNKHGDHDCDQPASWYLELHDFGRCQLGIVSKSPNVTELGFRAVFVCTKCKREVEKSAEKKLSKLPTPAVCPQWPIAHGCGRPVTRLDDLIPIRKPL